MGGKTLGIVLVLLGVAVVLLGLFADSLGIGVATNPPAVESQSSVFGWKQVLAVVVGAVLAAAGFLVARRPGAPTGR